METKANHLIIGAFELLMLAAGFAFIYWIENVVNGGGTSKRYDVVFDGSVQGLGEAGSVLFNGLRVGSVKDLSIMPEDTRKVRVAISVSSTTPVREDSRAQILQQGLAGSVALSITPGTPESPPLTPKAGETYPVIYADATSSGSLMNGVPEAIGNANALFVRLNDLVASNEKVIANTAKNVESFTAMLDANKEDITTVIHNARDLSTRFEALATKLDGAADQFTAAFSGNKDSIVTQAQQAAQSFRKLTEKLDKSLGDQADGLTHQAKSSMREFELFMRDGRRLAENLDRVLQKVESNPSTLIWGGAQVPEYKPGQ